jgi:hypothetical protein
LRLIREGAAGEGAASAQAFPGHLNLSRNDAPAAGG